MPKNVKKINDVILNKKSVGTQSDYRVEDDADSDQKLFDIGSMFSNLGKKSAYGDLLQRSITFNTNVDFDFVQNGRSKATQTLPDDYSGTPNEFGKMLEMREMESCDAVIPMHVKSLEANPRAASKESLQMNGNNSNIKIYDEEMPGTSRFVSSPWNRSEPLSLQNFENRACSVADSCAMVCSFIDKSSRSSKISNVACLYDRKGSARQSDEAVLLIQDYQSYDYRKTARWRENVGNALADHHRPMSFKKKKHSRKDALIRPVPITPEASIGNSFVCRICHEGEDSEPLIRPCLCKGSLGNIHAKCLKVWLEQSNTSRCEICGYPYSIRQTRRYTKCVSIFVFLRNIVDRRALMYDLISFVAVTPLCVVGIAMCIRASLISRPTTIPGASIQMGSVTRAGMIMLSSTIVIAYVVWLYTLISYHYKSWKKWYNSCYDVEVIPVSMTSEERLEALQKMAEEGRRRATGREDPGSLLTVLQPPNSHPLDQFFQRRVQPVIGPQTLQQ